MGDSDEIFPVELTVDEREVLRSGLQEWGGPARCSEELAVAMGFADVSDLFKESRRIRGQLEQSEGLTRSDWTRALIATEIVFTSDVLGSGTDWSATTGLSDDHTINVLRDLQRKLRRSTLIMGVGTRPATWM